MIPSFIDIRVLLCLLASYLLLCSAIRWYFSHLPFLCPVSCSLRPIMPVPRCHHGSSMEVCFSSSFILILLLAPFPMPMPAPAQVLTGWHCANLPPPSLSFVAHPSVALPPVSSFPSLSFPLISFIYFLTKKNTASGCMQHFICCTAIYEQDYFTDIETFHSLKSLCKSLLSFERLFFGTWRNALSDCPVGNYSSTHLFHWDKRRRTKRAPSLQRACAVLINFNQPPIMCVSLHIS